MKSNKYSCFELVVSSSGLHRPGKVIMGWTKYAKYEVCDRIFQVNSSIVRRALVLCGIDHCHIKELGLPVKKVARLTPTFQLSPSNC